MIRTTCWLTLTVILALGCNPSPGRALCGRYYSNLIRLQQNGHRALLAAARTSEGKKAIIDYCLQLTEYQVQCANQASTLNETMACETKTEESLLKRVLPFLNRQGADR